MASLDITKPPSLGVIARHLRQASAEFLVAMESHQQAVHKLQNVADLPAEELKEVCAKYKRDRWEKIISSPMKQNFLYVLQRCHFSGNFLNSGNFKCISGIFFTILCVIARPNSAEKL